MLNFLDFSTEGTFTIHIGYGDNNPFPVRFYVNYKRETIIGSTAFIAVILGFAFTGGLNALLYFFCLTIITLWSWWIYTVKTNSKVIFYWVKVPANIFLNPLLLILLLGSWSQNNFKAKNIGKYGAYDSEKKTNTRVNTG
ncbi:hypothetical protein [Desulfuromonas soudanensis]|uniref:hypothetical protein n=1 Tax=Desulfuromonas soudanensis TaxID=1603606 RepID=UPI000A7D71B1|nr:hypothetical protein [Desulfuromonas soudanensis]